MLYKGKSARGWRPKPACWRIFVGKNMLGGRRPRVASSEYVQGNMQEDGGQNQPVEEYLKVKICWRDGVQKQPVQTM
jgi:hypothetical protein